MKVYVKKAEALQVVEQHQWLLRGTMVKRDRRIAAEKVKKAILDQGQRMYRIPGRLIVIDTHNHDTFYESEVA